jgi:hypothetical protein
VRAATGHEASGPISSRRLQDAHVAIGFVPQSMRSATHFLHSKAGLPHRVHEKKRASGASSGDR